MFTGTWFETLLATPTSTPAMTSMATPMMTPASVTGPISALSLARTTCVLPANVTDPTCNSTEPSNPDSNPTTFPSATPTEMTNPVCNSTELVQAPSSSTEPNEEAHDLSHGSPDAGTSQNKQEKARRGKKRQTGKRSEARTDPRRDKPVPCPEARKKLQPTRSKIFKTFWNFCLTSLGMQKPVYTFNASDSEVKRLYELYKYNQTMCENAKNEANKFRIYSFLNVMLIAEIYQGERVRQHAELVRKSPHPERILPLDHPNRDRIGRDEALNILTRHLLGLGSKHKFCKDDPLRGLISEPIRIGRVLNALKDAIGWAAVIVPGLYLSNEQ
ncbi:hypothetical protein B0T17DRAFT_378950 [Bombardia bombarda]|uniref:Uncharacterized protein n=1 Tax=Bombardia bombarda TaxID=252184 RepID=A0AA39WGU0_9PEZI|nr:hypothetical protein B0T17DRAFT_378950 [Bombardia bombarda]